MLKFRFLIGAFWTGLRIFQIWLTRFSLYDFNIFVTMPPPFANIEPNISSKVFFRGSDTCFSSSFEGSVLIFKPLPICSIVLLKRIACQVYQRPPAKEGVLSVGKKEVLIGKMFPWIAL